MFLQKTTQMFAEDVARRSKVYFIEKNMVHFLKKRVYFLQNSRRQRRIEDSIQGHRATRSVSLDLFLRH